MISKLSFGQIIVGERGEQGYKKLKQDYPDAQFYGLGSCKSGDMADWRIVAATEGESAKEALNTHNELYYPSFTRAFPYYQLKD